MCDVPGWRNDAQNDLLSIHGHAQPANVGDWRWPAAISVVCHVRDDMVCDVFLNPMYQRVGTSLT
eukprot:scaffold95007_cov33-Tisochrysis_lutea.AAC.3